ncbi:MAG: hypothetical protein ACSHX7_13065 [Luteolibacter sp.]
MISPKIAIVAILFSSVSIALSQNEPKISLKIDFVAWGNPIHGLSLEGSDSKVFTAKSFTYSTPVKYSGSVLMPLYRDRSADDKVARPDGLEDLPQIEIDTNPENELLDSDKDPLAKLLAERRETEPNLVALIPLPKSGKRVTVLLVPARNETYIPYVMKDDASQLPVGKLKVHNFSALPVGLNFAGLKPFKLTKGKSQIVTIPNSRALYELAYEKDGKWKSQESNVFRVKPNQQTHFIVLQSKNQFFKSVDGGRSGLMQSVVLRRTPE